MKTSSFLLWLLLFAQGVSAATNFEFVVIGDTRPRFESESFRTFEALIPNINALEPAFVVNLGDLIYGYGIHRKEQQWDRYAQAVREFTVPYHQLPGNHDVFSKDAREVYARRFGRFYESFDYGGCHFVLLDNCEDRTWGEIGATQLDWLRHDLESTRAQSVFVFMHFPLWEPERVTPKYHAFWRDTLHPLFRASRVKAVFGGHAHCYGPTREFDGIRYFISGGGGAELLPDYRKAGGEHHFVKAQMADGKFDLRVVTPHGELTDGEADLMGGFLFAEKNSSRIGIVSGSQDPRQDVRFKMTLKNPYATPMTGKATWEMDRKHFAVNPEETVLQLQPGQSAQLAFNLKALDSSAPLETLPWLVFDVATGGQRHRFHREVLLLDSLKAPFCTIQPQLDGQTNDWPGMPLLTAGASESAVTVQSMHDTGNLYLAVDVPASGEPLNEDSAFHDQLQLGFAPRAGDTGFSGETLRLGLQAEETTVTASDRTPGHQPGVELSGVNAACRTNNGRTLFEVAIPKKLLPAIAGSAKNRFVLSLSFPVPGRSEPEPSEPSPGTFAYQIRYGGDSLVPVHFVELALSPAETKTP